MDFSLIEQQPTLLLAFTLLCSNTRWEAQLLTFLTSVEASLKGTVFSCKVFWEPLPSIIH